jgi:hypothetical protein
MIDFSLFWFKLRKFLPHLKRIVRGFGGEKYKNPHHIADGGLNCGV